MTVIEATNLAAVIIGPIVAVLITLWLDGRRKNRDQKVTVLRLLLATRHFPGDPNYQTAINLIPVEFGRSRRVMLAYREFIEAVRPGSGIDSNVKTTRLIYEVARCAGFSIRETDIQTSAYASQGWVDRDNLLIDSQRANRDIVSVLLMQTRLMASAPLSEEERRLIGLTPAGETNKDA